jgi:hypothetical protein
MKNRVEIYALIVALWELHMMEAPIWIMVDEFMRFQYRQNWLAFWKLWAEGRTAAEHATYLQKPLLEMTAVELVELRNFLHTM